MIAGIFVDRSARAHPARTQVDPRTRRRRRARDRSQVAPSAAKYSRDYTKSRALLIGIGEVYGKIGFQALPNAERDVDALAGKLREMKGEDWDIVTLKGAEAKNEADPLAPARAVALGAADDKLFVYYAGHGGEERRFPTAPAGSSPRTRRRRTQDPEHVSWVRFDEFSHVFDESQAKHVLVAMDCCYGGRLTTWRGEESPAAGSDRREAYGEALLTRDAQVVISSGRPFEAVSDGVSGENSPFVAVVPRGVVDADGAPR